MNKKGRNKSGITEEERETDRQTDRQTETQIEIERSKTQREDE